MANNLTTISKEGIEYLCKLINQTISLPSDVISDITLATNQTMSSVKIDKIIKQCLQDANTHAEDLCNALIKLTCEKTTVQPTLDNSELNIIYLFSSDGNAPFEQFLKISETELIDMGSTSISLNDYLTVTDAVNTYAKKVDLDTLTTEVNNIKSDFNTHKDDTVAHMTQTEKDNIVKKSNVTTTIDSTSTDDEIPSAKAVWNKYNIYDRSEAYSNIITDALNVNIFSSTSITNKDCIVSSECINKPTDLLWGIREVYWKSAGNIVVKINGMDTNNKSALWINTLCGDATSFEWVGWRKIATIEEIEKCLDIVQFYEVDFSGKMFIGHSYNGCGCVFKVPFGVKKVAFDLLTDGVFCQFGKSSFSGTLPTIISTGENRNDFNETLNSGTKYIDNISGRENIFIGGSGAYQITNVRVVEWY